MGTHTETLARWACALTYEDLTPGKIKLPKRQMGAGYVRPPFTDQNFVPEKYPED